MAPSKNGGDVVLPTISEINASTDILSQPDGAAKVVKVNDRFAVKFGKGVEMLEADNMRFISANTNVPMPKIFDAFTDPETKMTYIVMEFVPGATLQSLLPTLSAKEQSEINIKIRDAIGELRKLAPPNYLGGIGRKPYNHIVFWTPDNNPAISGPFANQAEMNKGMLERLQQNEANQYVQFMQGMVNQILRDHRTVLSHGDLQPKNIIVNNFGTGKDGSREFNIKLIDWEIAGWYPEYWEYCSSTTMCRWKPDWLEVIPHILDPYPVEYLLMQAIYSTVYY